ncbi:cytochrome P450 [Cristinia sonorae]|uniref:Cytochrome P450 n=1 Tax=Cristinia sonorae TaxID=1940300 RepID=A0A8K0UIP7_9AGAR|nr:cytochrome P450 [Cristinia sonorae]
MGLSLLLVGSILCIFLTRYLFRSGRRLPGPPRIPIVGNTLPPTAKIWELFAEYSKEFGPVFSLRFLCLNIIVVNSFSTCKEFFETRSAIYSGRKAPKMAELSGMHEGVLFQPDTARLRQGRKYIGMGLQPSALKAYQHIVHKNVISFLNRVLASPTDALSVVSLLPTSVALEIAYGYQPKSEDDEFVKRARISIMRFGSATALSPKDGFIVNLLPFLASLPAFLPGMSFKRTAAEWKHWSNEITTEGFQMVKSRMADGTATPSLLRKALEAKDGSYDHNVLKRTTLQIYSGGSDTTISAIKSFILAMTLHPASQAKAQAELDRHISTTGRLPTYSADRGELPYVLAVMREVLRWHSPGPITSRMNTEDDDYEGYRIKKGTTIIVNFWAIMHDEAVFPDHRIFRPERWLDGTILDKHGVDPLEVAFGFGRRVCPGRHLAMEVLFMTIASTLAIFDIKKAKDADGKDIVPKEDYVGRSLIMPLPFPCVVTPRSDATRQFLENITNALG